jgi:hypothetical protein
MLLGLLLAIAGTDMPPVGADHSAEIARHCSAESPDDKAMQDLCTRHAVQGVARFEQARKALGDKIEDELGGCIYVWTTNDVPDWGMIGACAKVHADSYHVTIP